MKRQKIEIPRDIRNTVKSRITKRVALAAALTLAVAVLIYFFGDTVFASFGSPSKEILYVILLVAIPLSFGIPFSFIDRTWCGEVTRVDIRTESASGGALRNGARIYTKHFVDLEIKRNDGKIIDRTVYEGTAATGRKFSAYQVGDRVVHVYGTKHIQVIHDNVSRPTVCVVCGTENPTDEKVCGSCGHTLHII